MRPNKYLERKSRFNLHGFRSSGREIEALAAACSPPLALPRLPRGQHGSDVNFDEAAFACQPRDFNRRARRRRGLVDVLVADFTMDRELCADTVR